MNITFVHSLCRAAVAVAAVLSVSTGFAEKVESSALVCADPQGWKLALEKESETEPGVEIWKLVATSPTNAVLPKFEVRFTHAADGIRHCWHSANPFWSGYQPDWRLNTIWGGDYKTGFGWNAGVNVALGDDECSRLTAITSEAREMVGVIFGYSESEGATFQARYSFGSQATDPCTNYCVRFRLDSRKLPYWQTVTEAMRWQRLAAGLDVTSAPEIAYDPVYSTWYAYGQNVSADAVLREAKAGAKMGLLNMFVDDGWNCETKDRKGPGYTICGDWEVAKKKFPNMAKHVQQVHDAGMKYVMWYALPQVGVKSKAYERFKGKYLIESPTHAILDPRYPEVRAFMTDFCVKAMDEWDVDGFKLDFIDTMRIWDNKDPAALNGFKGCDTRSLMKAVELFLKEVQTRCRERKRDTLVEFRQPYDGQAIRQYCNMVRVADCPDDIYANRVSIAKLRLVCADTAVHSDMLTWGKGVGAEDAALQILNSLFSVIQYSKSLADGLSDADRRMMTHWIRFTQEHRDALLRGAFRPHHPEQNYPVIEGENGLERIVAVYAANVPAPCIADRDVYLVNATEEDEILVEADAETTAELFDVFGEKKGTAKVAKGLHRLAVPKSGYAKVASVKADVVLAAGKATLRLSGASGAILSLKGADGVELLERADELFTLQLLDAKGNELRLRSSDFKLVDAESSPRQNERVGSSSKRGGDTASTGKATLVFTREEGPRVTMKIVANEGRFDFTPSVSCIPDGYVLEWFDGPQPYVASTGGKLYWPFYDGCEVTNLKQREGAGWIDYRPLGYTPRCKAWGALYPGNCQMQFMAFYKDGRGVYFGCHDPTHTQMGVEYDWRSERATRLSLQMFCGETKEGVWTSPAPFTLRLFNGGWMEACEIYRDFIHTLPEFQTAVKRPKWMYDSPVNLIYPVQGEGIDHGPMTTNRYYPFINVMPEVEKYGKLFDSKIMALIMHWEGTSPWCPPYVWPPLGGEEGLAKLRDALHARGDLLGLYCSGCAWTQVSCINGYSQEKKCRDEGLERWMMRGPKGQLEATICNHRFAQRFGYDLCLTEKWSQETLVEEIGKIAAFGVDYCQYFDQNIGGAALLCYSRDHHHPPVPGAWQTKAMLDLQDKVFAKIDEVGSPMTLGCEACAATPFVKNLFYNDSRANNDVSYGNPVAGLPFVFHEWMSNFSGNQIGHDADVGYRWMRSLHYGESFSVILGADGKLQNAWGILWNKPRPDQERLIALVKNLNAVRKANLPWLLEGKMLKPFAKVETRPVTVKYGKLDVATEEIMSSFWQAPDGRRRAFLSNWGLKNASTTVTFEDGTKKVYELKPGEVVWFDAPERRLTSFRPGQVWLDDTGKPIQAHAGSILKIGDTYWWYGENKEHTDGFGEIWHWGVRAYTSKDLYNWHDEGLIIPPELDDVKSPLHPYAYMDRPHILYNEKTKKYVCWLKIMQEPEQSETVLTADSIRGPWTKVRTRLHPCGLDAGDFDLVKGPDGKAYYYFERPHTELIVAELTDDYTDANGTYKSYFPLMRPPFTREAPSYFFRDGKHYLLTSGTTGYWPNPSEFAVAKDFLGPWERIGDACPTDRSETSFHAQFGSVYKVPGKKDLYIALGDRWIPSQMDLPYAVVSNAFDKATSNRGNDADCQSFWKTYAARKTPPTREATYVWLPIVFKDGKPEIRWHDEWRLEDFE